MLQTGNLNDDERLEIAEILAKSFKDPKKIALWLILDNPMLGGISPAVMISLGRGQKLLSYMRQMISENEPFEGPIDAHTH